MARFRAFDSDASSSDDEPETQNARQEKPSTSRRAEEDEESDRQREDDESSDSDGSSSAMHEDELIEGWRETSSRPRKALTQDENGDFQVTGDDDDDDDIHFSGSETSSAPSSPAAEPRPTSNIIPWARHVGVDAQKMHVMQTSLFRMPEEAAALKALNSQPPKSKTLGAHTLPSMNRKHSRDSEAGEGLRADSREVCRVTFVVIVIVLTLSTSAPRSRTISSLRCSGHLVNMHASMLRLP